MRSNRNTKRNFIPQQNLIFRALSHLEKGTTEANQIGYAGSISVKEKERLDRLASVIAHWLGIESQSNLPLTKVAT